VIVPDYHQYCTNDSFVNPRGCKEQLRPTREVMDYRLSRFLDGNQGRLMLNEMRYPQGLYKKIISFLKRAIA
jgi:hypothetical protein